MDSKGRAARAAGRILDRYGVHAEWARLKGRPDQGEFQRGRWYPVADFDSKTSVATLDVDGEDRSLASSLLVWLKDVPDRATVFSPSTFGPVGTEMKWAAVCPKGHAMGEVQPKDQDLPLACADCHGREWSWEWESDRS